MSVKFCEAKTACSGYKCNGSDVRTDGTFSHINSLGERNDKKQKYSQTEGSQTWRSHLMCPTHSAIYHTVSVAQHSKSVHFIFILSVTIISSQLILRPSSRSKPSSAAWQQTPSPVSAYWSAWQIVMNFWSRTRRKSANVITYTENNQKKIS
jgi:hypothetical protein